jgi:hypothetical protein
MDNDINDLREQLKNIQESSVPLKSLWTSSHSVYTDDKILSYEKDILTINGKTESMEFIPFKYDINFNYNRGIIGRMADSFDRQNDKLLFLVCGISILFLVFIVIARHQNRKKFLYNFKNNEGEEDKN